MTSCRASSSFWTASSSSKVRVLESISPISYRRCRSIAPWISRNFHTFWYSRASAVSSSNLSTLSTFISLWISFNTSFPCSNPCSTETSTTENSMVETLRGHHSQRVRRCNEALTSCSRFSSWASVLVKRPCWYLRRRSAIRARSCFPSAIWALAIQCSRSRTAWICKLKMFECRSQGTNESWLSFLWYCFSLSRCSLRLRGRQSLSPGSKTQWRLTPKWRGLGVWFLEVIGWLPSLFSKGFIS